MNTPNNKRRRESQRRMEKAFTQLLQDRELTEVTVTDICKLADVNRTTFYANYQDIYALSEAVQARLKEEVLALYQEEWERSEGDHDFIKLFRHIRDNQLFYKTYFKLRSDGSLDVIGYDLQEASKYYGGKHIEYHIEFFGHGLNAVIKKWLQNDCRETPEEMCEVIETEYRKALPARDAKAR